MPLSPRPVPTTEALLPAQAQLSPLSKGKRNFLYICKMGDHVCPAERLFFFFYQRCLFILELLIIRNSALLF